MRSLVIFAFAAAILPSALARAADAPTVRVRAYVDEGYGKDADKKLATMFAQASAMLQKDVGATLALVDTKPWKPKSPAAPKNVRPGLVEIESTDKGSDVDVVIAFIGAGPANIGNDLHKLGLAQELGKHAVVRRVDDDHEAAVILLHEVAHALGGVDVSDASDIMAKKYAAKQTGFHEDSAALFKLSLDIMQAKTEKDRGSALARLERDVDKRKAKLDSDGLSDFRGAIDDLAEGASSDVVAPKEQASAMNDAVVAMNAGDVVKAWKLLKPVADAKDAPVAALSLACRVVSYDKIDEPDAVARCDRALAASVDDVDTANGAIRTAMKKKDLAAAKRAFTEAKVRLNKAKPGPDVDELAALAQGTGRITLAEDALAKSSAKDADALKHKLLLERRRAGLPRGAVDGEDEPAYLDTILSFENIKAPGDEIDAVDRAVKRFGDVPGLAIARCDALVRKERYRDAESVCDKALAKYDEASVGHVVAGIAYDLDEVAAKAMPHLLKALELDPDYEPAYAPLARIYHRIGKKAELGQLEAAYAKRFGKPLVRGNDANARTDMK